MIEPVIRRAGSADAEALAALGRATFVETFGHLYPPQDLAEFLQTAYSVEAIAAQLADPAASAWLAEAQGAPVGYAQAGPCALPHPEVTAACGELKRLYLLGAWQGRGLGARLMETAMAWLSDTRAGDLWIGVWSENFGAQRFYGRYGFSKVGEYDFLVGRSRDREFILRRPEHGRSP